MMAYQTNYKPRQTNAFEVMNNVRNNLNHLNDRLFQQQNYNFLDLSKVLAGGSLSYKFLENHFLA